MTDKTPTLVEELQSLFNGGAVRDYGAAPVIELATRHEQAWQAKLAEVEAERDQLRHSWGAAARTVRALREELECGSYEESLPKLQAILATLTAERERADRAERERDAAQAHVRETILEERDQRQRAESAEAENARLRAALEAVIREITDENANDRNALGSCIEVIRIAREALTSTAPTGETR
jgi:chromosome segregation ATPase